MSRLFQRIDGLQIQQGQTSVTSEVVPKQLHQVLVDMQSHQNQTEQDVQTTGAAVRDQAQEIGTLEGVSRQSSTNTSAAASDQGQLQLELQQHRDATRILTEKYDPSNKHPGSDDRRRRKSTPGMWKPAEGGNMGTMPTFDHGGSVDGVGYQQQRNVADRQATIAYSQVTAPPNFALYRYEDWEKHIPAVGIE